MGSRYETGITSRSEKSLTIQFMYEGRDCRETLKLEPNKKNIQYVSRLRSEILRKIEIGTFVYEEYFPNSKKIKTEDAPVTIPTLNVAADKWLSIKKSELSTSAIDTYSSYLKNHWLPKFGDKRIDNILTTEITAHLAKINVINKTRNNILVPLRGIYADAFYDFVITNDPTARIKNLKVQKTEPDPFTPDEIDLIINSMKENYHQTIANYFEFAFFTGLRPCEQIELKWSDVNTNSFTVRRALVRGKVKNTKTHKVREVLLNQRAMDALSRQKQLTYGISDFIFNNPQTENQWTNEKYQNIDYWHPTIDRLNLRYRVPYQTRHTYASIQLTKGVNPMWVSKQMGHVTMKMLLEVYSKWIDLSDKQKELEKVNQLLFGTNFVQK